MEKSTSEFYALKTARDGLQGRCKKCVIAAVKRRYEADPEAKKRRVAEWQKNNPERMKEYRVAQGERPNIRAKEHYRNNREACIERARQWRLANPEKFRDHQRNRSVDKAVNCEKQMRRYASERRQTPPWVSKADLVPIYRQCQVATEQTGVPHHVDHIVPLRGETVSGLHVPWNLQVIPAKVNQAKGNRLIESMALHS